MRRIITEITPLSEKDCFYLIDRYKEAFDYPLHHHDEFELNFIANCSGARRIVGDSIEETGRFDLVLIGGGLEHTWEQHNCTTTGMREITIQFSSSLLHDSLLAKNQLETFRSLFKNAQSGIAFDVPCIMRIYSRLDEITRIQTGFYRVLKFLEILYELSVDKDFRLLSSSSFANTHTTSDSRRVQKVDEYINSNYSGVIRLEDLADLAGMTPTSFSRFFKLRTGRTVSDYIIDKRIGFATRKLVDSAMSVSEIAYTCGFGNISNFNRMFKRKKGCTPKEFRDNYRKNKVIV